MAVFVICLSRPHDHREYCGAAGGSRSLLRRSSLPLYDEEALQAERKSRWSSLHLSRGLYQALHELEALQTKRSGMAAPLARLDVQGLES